MLVLNRERVIELLDPVELVKALSVAMVDLTQGTASMPPRNMASVGSDGLLSAMPAYLPTQNVLAAKLVTVFHGNIKHNLETHQAVVVAFDPETGVPTALIDGRTVTAIRTAAGSALATQLCARKEAGVLAILGTGVQAHAHASVLPRVRKITEIVFAGRSPEKAQALASEFGARVAPSFAEAADGADIVCCCTNSTEPILQREWLRPGTHVNSVGFAPGFELSLSLFVGSRVVVESKSAAIGQFPHGAPDLTAALESGLLQEEDLLEVGELVGGLHPGRVDDSEITVYRSVGVAVQDAAAAGLLLDAARGAPTVPSVNL